VSDFFRLSEAPWTLVIIYASWGEDQIIVIGTQGSWETADHQGQMYGKERLLDLIRRHRDRSAQEIVQTITHALVEFRHTAPQQDDITLVVVRTDFSHSPITL